MSRAVVIATGVNSTGDREVLGIDVGDSEGGAFWTAFLKGLRARRLTGVQLVISDHHLGLKHAIGAVFVGAGWQRCRSQLDEVARMLDAKFPDVATTLRDACEDLLAFTGFPIAHWRRIWSTNPLERINGESKRRTNVVGIFANDASILRLVTALLVETHDEWAVAERRYLSEESMVTPRGTIAGRGTASLAPSTGTPVEATNNDEGPGR